MLSFCPQQDVGFPESATHDRIVHGCRPWQPPDWFWPRPSRRPAARAIRSPRSRRRRRPSGVQARLVVPQPPPPDPITVLIDASQQRFLAGERELKLGHLEQARESSSTARSKCCSSRRTAPGPTPVCASTSIGWSIGSTPTRSPPSRRATGSPRSGPSPRRSTSSCKIATFPKPAPGADTEKAVKADLAATEHDVPIPQNDRVLVVRRALPGPAARLHPREPDARHRSTCR